jgi:hypothetical protein
MPDCNRTYPCRIDVRLTEAERQFLNEQALKRGISRQELLRARVLSEANQPAPIPEIKPVHFSRGRDSIDTAMHAVNKRYNVNSRDLEGIVCTVICALNAKR